MPILSDTPDGPTLASPLARDDVVGDYFSGLVKSGAYGLTDLIGVDPPRDVLQWRQDHPWGNLLSGFVAPTGEFGGAMKLGKYLLKGSTAFKDFSEARPILSGVLQHSVGMVPISGARIAGAAIAGGNVGDVVRSSIVDQAMAAGMGGLEGLVKAPGLAKPVDPFASSDLSQPLQLRGRELLAQMPDLPTELAGQARTKINDWGRAIREETGSQARPFMGFSERPLATTIGDQALPEGASNRDLNKLFAIPKRKAIEEGGTTPATLKRRLTTRPDDFADDATLAKVVADANLPPDYEFQGQHFRHISFTNQQAAGSTARTVKNNLLDIGDGWFLGKEQDIRAMGGAPSDQGGLYVMAKRVGGPAKVRAGQPIGNEADQWLVFKTDNPGFFNPKGQRFADTVGKWSWDPAEDPALQALIGKNSYTAMADSMNKTIPETAFKTGPQGIMGLGPRAAPVTWEKGIGTILSKATGWGDAGYGPEAVGRFVREHFAPMMNQFAGNPTARKIATTMSALFKRAENEATAAIYGTGKAIEGSLWKDAIRSGVTGGAREGGLADTINALDDTGLAQLNSILADSDLRTMSPDKLPGSVQPGVREIVKGMQGLDESTWMNTRSAEAAADIPEDERLKHLSGYMSLSRSWQGGWRVPVYDDVGDLIAIGAGKGRGQAQKMAKALVEEAKAQGKKWTTDIHKTLDMSEGSLAAHDLATEGALKARSRVDWNIINRVERAGKFDFMKQRSNPGIGGYEGQGGFNKRDLISKLHDYALTHNKRQATLALNSIYRDNLTKLHEVDPSLGRQLAERLEQLNGKQGEFSRTINRATDKLLAPFIGHNSASKIVGVVSKYLHALRYGFMTLGFPVVNILNFTQTHFPEMAFLAGGAPESVSKYYSHGLVLDGVGNPRGKLGIMQMMRLQLHSLRQLRDPDPEFRKILSDAIANGDLDQRMVKDFVGGDASIRDHFRAFKTAKGAEKIYHGWKLIEGLGTLPANVSERLSRLQTYALAYNLGKDVLALPAETGQLRQFMNEFTSRTMFNYGTADKAKIFSGPVGSSIGLFKNWMLHYMWNMADYLGEANRGNLKPIMYAAALPALFGGVPATGGAYYIADKISRMFGNKPLMERIYGSMGADDPRDASMADLVYQGLPGYLPKLVGMPGVSLTQQLAMPMADPTGELTYMTTPALWDQGKLMYNALLSLRQGYNATGAVTPDAWSSLSRAFLPKTFYRAFDSAATGMIKSSNTTAPAMTNLSPMERFLYTMGINPSRTALYYEIKTNLTAEQQDLKAMVSKMGQEWALAEDTGNSQMMRRVITRAMVKGIDITSVMRSAKGYAKRLNENGLSNNLNKGRAIALQRMTGVNLPMPNDALAVLAGT